MPKFHTAPCALASQKLSVGTLVSDSTPPEGPVVAGVLPPAADVAATPRVPQANDTHDEPRHPRPDGPGPARAAPTTTDVAPRPASVHGEEVGVPASPLERCPPRGRRELGPRCASGPPRTDRPDPLPIGVIPTGDMQPDFRQSLGESRVVWPRAHDDPGALPDDSHLHVDGVGPVAGRPRVRADLGVRRFGGGSREDPRARPRTAGEAQCLHRGGLRRTGGTARCGRAGRARLGVRAHREGPGLLRGRRSGRGEPSRLRRGARSPVRRPRRDPGPVPQAARGGGQRAGRRVRRNRPPPLRSDGGRRDGADPPALRGAGHVCRGGEQLAPATARRRAAGVVAAAVRSHGERRRGGRRRLRPCPGAGGSGPRSRHGARPAAGDP